MTMKPAAAAFAIALLMLVAGAIGLSAPAEAKSQGPMISAAVGKPLQEAQKLMDGKDYQGALAKIKEAQAVSSRTPYDDYVINSFLGIAAFNLNDHATADTAFEAAADSDQIPDAEKKDTYYKGMIFANEAGHYQKTVHYAQLAQQANAFDDKMNQALAVAYYSLNDYANAKVTAQKSIDAAKAAGTQPDQNMLAVLQSSMVKTNDVAGISQVLEQSVMANGDPTAWAELIDIASRTKGISDIDELHLARLRMATNAKSTTDDYSMMASVALLHGYLGEAQTALEHGGKANASLAEVRAKAARDKAALPTYDAAARKSPAGEQDVKLAETYYDYGRYADAEIAARRAIGKGGMKDPQEGPLVLGEALAAQGKFTEASDAFAKVSGTAAQQQIAHLWALYAQSKAKGTAASAAPAPAAQ